MINSFRRMRTGKRTGDGEADGGRGSGRGTGKRTGDGEADGSGGSWSAVRLCGCSAVRAAAALLPRMASGERKRSPRRSWISLGNIQGINKELFRN